jgi:hypothetical protein
MATPLTTQQFWQQFPSLVASYVAGTTDTADFEAAALAMGLSWGVSNPDLANLIVGQAASNVTLFDQVADFFAGTSTGGVGPDGTGAGGYYPITNAAGVTNYYPCPATQIVVSTFDPTTLSNETLQALGTAMLAANALPGLIES